MKIIGRFFKWILQMNIMIRCILRKCAKDMKNINNFDYLIEKKNIRTSYCYLIYYKYEPLMAHIYINMSILYTGLITTAYMKRLIRIRDAGHA